MEFLDPKKQKAHKIRLIVGYCLIGIALALTTVILLYRAYGFGFDPQGRIIQNGLVFVSSTPNPAQVYINNEKYKADTNVRIPLPAGQYTFELRKDGYLPWKRAITVEGGSVRRFDYPFLIPKELKTNSYKTLTAKPRLLTNSPDRRWLIAQYNDSFARFNVFDLNNTTTAESEEIVLPDGLVTAGDANTATSWELVQWSADNQHVLLKRIFQKDGQKTWEFVMLDRETPSESKNLTTTWGINPTTVQLQDRVFDKYYMLDQSSQTLYTANAKESKPKELAKQVSAFKSYGKDIVLYATRKNTKDGAVDIRWYQDGKEHTLKSYSADIAQGATFTLDITRYDGDWFVVTGASTENKAYVYRNPLDLLSEQDVIVPVHVLKVPGVNYVQFSNNARFIMAENGTKFAVYDAEYDNGFNYESTHPLDAPQTHATWMDGHRITYTSKGKVEIFDFDNANQHALVANDAGLIPVFDRDYENLYTLSAGTTAEAPFVISKTPLRTGTDL